MAITRYAGDRFYGLEEEKTSLLVKVLDGAYYIASDTEKQYVKKDGAWLEIGGSINGSGISGYLPVWTDGDTLGNSTIYQSGANIGINTINPEHALHISGDVQISGYLYDYNNTTGQAGYVLTSEENGPQWKQIEDVLSGVGGVGESGYVTRWFDEDTLTTGVIYDDGASVGIGTTTLAEALTVNGKVEADEFLGELRGPVVFGAKAAEALVKGEAVYISGISGNTTVVAKACANETGKMPVFGLAHETVNANAFVEVTTFGTLSNINTSSFLEGDELFIGITAGALVNSPPTGEAAQIQKVAKVTRSDATVGSVKVMGAGRSNATPNLNEGRLFVGNSSNQAVADGTVYVDIANSKVGINTTSPQHNLHVSGSAIISGYLYDSTNSTGAAGYVLTSENNGPQWKQIEDVLSGVGGSGATNYVARWADEDTLTSGVLYDNGTNVGVGTINPGYKLEVSADTNSTVNLLRLRNADGTYSQAWDFQLDTSKDLVITGNSATGGIKMLPGSRGLTLQDTGGDVKFTLDRTDARTYSIYTDSNSKLHIRDEDASADRLTILSSGNVGVGTTDPLFKLHVNGDIYQDAGGGIFSNSNRGWYRQNYATTGAGVSNGKIVTLNPPHGQTASNVFHYIFELTTAGTSTNTGATYIGVYNADTSAWVLRAVSLSGTTSNHPQLSVSGNNFTVYTNSSSNYTIVVSVTTVYNGDADSTAHSLGANYQWQRAVNNLYYNDGNVGIGTNDSSATLELSPSGNSLSGLTSKALIISNTNDTSWTADALASYNATTGYDITDLSSLSFFARPTQSNILIFASEAAGTSTLHRFINLNSSSTAPLNRWDFYQYDGSGTGSDNFKVPDKLFQIRVREGASVVEKFTIKGNGNIGIGTNSPAQQLHLTGSIRLPNTTNTTTGIIYKDTSRFIHNYQHPTGDTAVPAGFNTFVGLVAGNLSMGSTATSVSHGSYNSGFGYQVLNSLTTGYSNTAIGFQAGEDITTGFNNTVVGMNAGGQLVGGSRNTFIGDDSGLLTNSGINNTALGAGALRLNTTGSSNTIVGTYSLDAHTSPAGHTTLGYAALTNLTTGSYNIAIGYAAGSQRVATGNLTNASYGIYLGYGVDGTEGASGEIVIGKDAQGLGSNTTRLGGSNITKTVIEYGNVGIGTVAPSQKLHVQGNLRVTGAYYDSNNEAGTSNQVLTSTGLGGTDWKSLSQIGDTVTGSGTTNKITKWSDGPNSDLTDSSFLSESGTTLTNTATVTEFTTTNTQLRLPNYGRVAIGAASTNSVLLANVGDNATFNNGEAVIKGENSGNRGTVGHASGSDLLRLNFSDALGMILNKDGHVGIGTDPKAKFEVDLNQTSGTLAADNYAHFGGQHHTNGSVMGITLGYREANLLYRKVGIVARGLGDNAARQDLDFLVSTATGSASVTPADAKLTISGSTGYVGIGTTNPGTLLDVRGIVSVRESSNIAFYGGNYIRLFVNANFSIREVGGATRLNLDTTNGDLSLYNSSTVLTNHIDTAGDSYFNGGNVGIGTTVPDDKLDVVGQFRISGNKSATTNKTNRIRGEHYDITEEPVTFMFMNSFSTTNTLYIGGGSSVENAATQLNFFTAANNTTTTGTLRMLIQSDGNVGIGTPSPTGGKLQVAGKVRIDAGSGNDALNLNAYDLLKWDGANLIHFGGYQSSQWQELHFYANGAKALSIDASQNVGIGTANPEGKLHVFSGSSGTVTASTAANELVIEGSGDAGLNILSPDNKESNIFLGGPGLSYGGLLRWKHSDLQLTLGTNVSNAFIAFNTDSGTERMRITSAGNVGIGNTVSQVYTNENTSTVNLRVGSDTLSANQSSTIQIGGRDSSGGGTLGAIEFFNHRDDSIVAKIQVRRDLESSTKLSAGQIDFYTDDGDNNLNARMSIDALGNVGIGTTSPGNKLEVVSAVDAQTATFRSTNNRASVIVQSSATNQSSYLSLKSSTSEIAFLDGRYDSNFLRIATNKTGAYIALETGVQSEAVRILSDGNVGIGTTSPAQQLEITKNFRLPNSTATTGIIYKDTSRFIHNFSHPSGSTAIPTGRNTFVGEDAGNLTMGATATSTAHGSYNSGYGWRSLYSVTNGYGNAAFGYGSGRFLTTGIRNTLVGYDAGQGITTTHYNVAVGYDSLIVNATGTGNTAVGSFAADTTTGSDYLVVMGYQVMANMTSGNYNVALGYRAGYTNTAASNLLNAEYGVFIGPNTNPTEGSTNEIVIGNGADGNGSNTATLGNDSITKTILKGNVGIGNTNPQGTLDLGNATGGKSIVWGGSSGTNHYTSIWSEYGTGSLVLAGGLKSSTSSADFIYPYTGTYGYAAIELDSFHDDGIKFYTAADAARTADTVATKQERMRIDTSGNVGLGTASPSQKLHVQGNLRLTGAFYDSNNTAGTSGQVLTSTGSATDWKPISEIAVTGSGTINKLPLWNGTSSLTDSIITQSSTNYVTVFGGFRVSGNHGDTGSQLNLWCDSSGHGKLAVFDMQFLTGSNSARNNTALFLKNDGNVGIGTTIPTLGKLQVAGRGYFGPVGTGDATTKALMDTYSVLKLKPHDSNSTNMTFAQVNNGNAIGIQVTNSTQTADWDIALNPYGGNVGIGTDDPDAKLDVRAASGSVGLTVGNTTGDTRLQISSTENSDVTFNVGDASGMGTGRALIIKTGNSERMRIAASSGNVGIGNTVPEGNLEISDSATNTELEISTWSTNDIHNSILRLQKSASDTVNTLAATAAGEDLGEIQARGVDTNSTARTAARILFQGDAAPDTVSVPGRIVFSTSNTSGLGERMRIDDDGYVGIGTDNPKYKLDANAGLSSGGGIAYPVRVGHGSMATNGDGVGVLFSRGSAEQYFGYVRIQSTQSNPDFLNPRLEFGIQDTDTFNLSDASTRMVIIGSGNVGIGTTSPSKKLHVAGSTLISNNNYHYGFTSGGAQATLIGIKSNNYVTVGQLNANNVGTDIYGGTGNIYLYSGSVNRLTVSSDVNVQGATDLNINGPSRRLSFASGTGTIRTTTSNNLILQTNSTSAITIYPTQQIQFNAYGSGTFTGTATQRLAVDSSGNVIEIPIGSGPVDGSGAANKVTYWTDTDTISYNNNFHWDNTNGNLGIGTSVPSSTLHVSDSTSGSSVLKVDGTSGTIFEVTDDLSSSLMSVNTIAGLPVFEVFADNHIVAGRYNQNDFYLDTNGNLGLGTNAPSKKLEVVNSTAAQILAKGWGPDSAGNDGGAIQLGEESAFHGLFSYDNATSILYIDNAYNSSSGDIRFRTKTSGTSITAVTIEGDGDVGIGTTSPVYKLDLYDATDSASKIGFHNATTGATAADGTRIGLNGAELFINNQENAAIKIYTQSTQTNGITILGSGSVGIGTVSPLLKLHVEAGTIYANSAKSDTLLATNIAGTVTHNMIGSAGYWGIRTATNNSFNLDVYNGGSPKAALTVLNNGNVGIGTASPESLFHIHSATNETTTIISSIVNATNGSYLRLTEGGESFGTYGYLGGYIQYDGDNNLINIGRHNTNGTSLSDDNPVITIERDTGDVGIGTVSPSAKLQVAGNTYLNSGSNVWNLIGNNGINFARETYFGYSSSYRILQLGTAEATRAISIGVDVSSNASGSFGGDEIIFPNQREIITPNAADNGYLGLIATDNQNKVRIGNYRWNILNDTPGITIDTSASTNYVGIGTISPGYRLDVVEAGGVASARIRSTNANIARLFLSNTVGTWRLYSAAASNSFRIFSDSLNNDTFVIKSDGNVGIGTTSPNDKLEIYGNMRVRGSDGFGANSTANYNPSYVAFPGGGKIGSSSSTETGYIKITLPQSWTSTMMQFSIDVFEYQDNKAKTFVVAGYNYSVSSSWHNASAMVLAGNDGATYKVQFGHDGSKCAIYISKGSSGASSSWTYPHVVVKDASFGFLSTDISNWIDGWSVSFSTATLSGITQTRDIKTQITGTGTSQYIPKWGSTGTALSDSVIVQNNSNIGIGTATPSQKLHVNVGRIAVTDGYNIGDTDADTGMFPSSNALYFQTAGTTRATITSAGNVGIGTANPSEKLHVNGLTQLGAAGKTEGGAIINYASFSEIKNAAATLIGNAVVPGTANNTIQHSKTDAGNYIKLKYNQGITFHTNITNTIDTDISEDTNESVRIDLNGNVGIGTASPTKKLHVNGDVRIIGHTVNEGWLQAFGSNFGVGNNSYGVFLGTYSGGTSISPGEIILATQGKSGWGFGDGLGRIRFFLGDSSGVGVRDVAKIEAVNEVGNGTTAAGGLAFHTSPFNSQVVERMRIGSDGNVGIGTGDPDSGLTIAKNQTPAHTYTTSHLHLATPTTSDNGGATTISFATSTSDNYGWSLSAIRETTNGYDTRFAFKSHNNSDSGSEVLSVLADGNVGIGTDNPTRKLDVRGNATNAVFRASSTSGADAGIQIQGARNGTVDDETSYIHFTNYDNNASPAGVHNLGRIYGSMASAQGRDGKITIESFDGTSYQHGLTVDEEGNVGIGTISPVGKLHVNGMIKAGIAGNSSANTPALLVSSAGVNPEQSAIAIQQGTTEGDTIIFADYEPYVEWGLSTDNGLNTIEFTGGTNTNNLGSKTLYNQSGNARTAYKKAIVDLTSGNMSVGGSVGIGTTNPSGKLHVNGSAVIGDSTRESTILTIRATNTAGSPASTAQILMEGYEGRGIGTFYTDSTYSGEEWFCGMNYSGNFNSWNIGYDEAGGQAEYLANTKLQLHHNGKLQLHDYGAGTFTGTATQRLAVDASGNVIEIDIGSGAVDGNGIEDYVARWTDTETLGIGKIRDDNSTVAINTAPDSSYMLKVAGNGYFSGTLTEASSLAIKENIENFTPSIDKINKIRPVKYNKKGSDKKEIGLIAEELEELFPELVEKDENGNPSGVNYSRAVTVLLGGFKELYKELQEIKKRI